MVLKAFFIGFLLLGLEPIQAQSINRLNDTILPNLYEQLRLANEEDTVRAYTLDELAEYYGFVRFDSCLFYAAQGLALSQKLIYLYGEMLGYRSMFSTYNCQANFPRALEAGDQVEHAALCRLW